MGCSLIQILKDLPLLPWAAGKNALSKVKDTDLALILLLQTLEKKLRGKLKPMLYFITYPNGLPSVKIFHSITMFKKEESNCKFT